VDHGTSEHSTLTDFLSVVFDVTSSDQTEHVLSDTSLPVRSIQSAIVILKQSLDWEECFRVFQLSTNMQSLGLQPRLG
jgi:hypothetical protein